MALATLNHQAIKRVETVLLTPLEVIRLVEEMMGLVAATPLEMLLGVLLAENQDRCLSILVTMLSVNLRFLLLKNNHLLLGMRRGKNEKHGKTTLGLTAVVPAGLMATENGRLADIIRLMEQICLLRILLITAQEAHLEEKGSALPDRIDTTVEATEAPIEEEKRIEQRARHADNEVTDESVDLR